MNLTNMRKLRTRMRSRKNPVGFNMNHWFMHNKESRTPSPAKLIETVETHACGTVACLAGHTAIMAMEEGWSAETDPYGNWVYNLARGYLGLELGEADDLFYGRWWSKYQIKNLSDISKAEAIKELTRLIKKEEASQ